MQLRRFLSLSRANFNVTTIRRAYRDYATNPESNEITKLNSKIDAAEIRIQKLENDLRVNDWMTTFVFTLAFFGIGTSLLKILSWNSDNKSIKKIESNGASNLTGFFYNHNLMQGNSINDALRAGEKLEYDGKTKEAYFLYKGLMSANPSCKACRGHMGTAGNKLNQDGYELDLRRSDSRSNGLTANN